MFCIFCLITESWIEKKKKRQFSKVLIFFLFSIVNNHNKIGILSQKLVFFGKKKSSKGPFDMRKSGKRPIMQSCISDTVYHTGRNRVPLHTCIKLLHETLKIPTLKDGGLFCHTDSNDSKVRRKFRQNALKNLSHLLREFLNAMFASDTEHKGSHS